MKLDYASAMTEFDSLRALLNAWCRQGLHTIEECGPLTPVIVVRGHVPLAMRHQSTHGSRSGYTLAIYKKSSDGKIVQDRCLCPLRQELAKGENLNDENRGVVFRNLGPLPSSLIDVSHNSSPEYTEGLMRPCRDQQSSTCPLSRVGMPSRGT